MAGQVLSLQIAKPLVKELDRLSQQTGRETSVLVEEAVAEYLFRENARINDIDEAVIAADEGEFISDEAMTAWLASWGTDNELDPPKPDIFKSPR